MATSTLPQPNRHVAPAQQPPPAIRIVGIIVALAFVLSVVFIAFALPAAKSAPRDVPIGVAGPGASAAQVEQQLARNAPDAFQVTNYGEEAALREAILRRDVYGGIAFTPQGPTLLIATGGSPMVAAALNQIGTAMAQQAGASTHIEDLAPLPSDDARGVGLSAAALPLTLAGLLPAVALLLALPHRPWLRFGAFTAAAAVMALTITALLQFVFGSINSHFWAVSAGLLLGVLAMGLPVLGLGSVLGRVGIGIGAAVAVLLGNPLSGLASAPELLPHGWSTLGQVLPQGANATLLRSTAYFPEPFSSGTAGSAMIVLGFWVLAGVALIAVARR
jgi:hypothetical protein